MYRHIVIIGGIGPQSSLELHRRLIDRAAAAGARHGHEYPRITHLSIPIRDLIGTGGGTGTGGGDGGGDGEREPAAVTQIAAAAGGIDLDGDTQVVIACNTAHLLIDEIAVALGHPVRSMIADTVAQVMRAAPTTVGLLASPATIGSDLYGAPLRAAGARVLTPDAGTLDELDDLIGAIIANEDPATAVPAVRRIVAAMTARGAKAVVLGCTELSLTAPALAMPGVVDPLDALVAALMPARSAAVVAKPRMV